MKIMVFCICYDLKAPGRDYTTLISAIKTYGTWWHHLDSTWFIETTNTNTAVAIRDYLRTFIDRNDELLVFPVATGWAGVGFQQQAYDWLRDHWN